jgi:transcriptional regulator with XRE-family HTH domain
MKGNYPDYAVLIGSRLRAARKGQKLRLADVAEWVGISVPYLSDIERGRSNSSLAVIVRIARAVDVSLDALVEGVVF